MPKRNRFYYLKKINALIRISPHTFACFAVQHSHTLWMFSAVQGPFHLRTFVFGERRKIRRKRKKKKEKKKKKKNKKIKKIWSIKYFFLSNGRSGIAQWVACRAEKPGSGSIPPVRQGSFLSQSHLNSADSPILLVQPPCAVARISICAHVVSSTGSHTIVWPDTRKSSHTGKNR